MAYHNGLQRQSGLPRPEPWVGPSPSSLVYPPGNDYPLELFNLLESVQTMKKHGYVMEPLTAAELNEKARCKHCNQTILSLQKDLQKKIQHRLNNLVPPPPKEVWDPLPTLLVNMGEDRYETQECAVFCNFHPGVVNRSTKYYNCCGTHVSEAKPCVTVATHEIRDYAPGALSQCYQFYATPISYPGAQSIRGAVAIDCEMGTAVTGDSELIRLTAIDYRTGEILINNLVQPDQQLLHLNTRFSGVTWKQMDEAKRNRTCLKGKAGAREALWRYVGPLTALVGHGLSNDLRALRWIHPTVIDSYMVEHKIVQAKKRAEEEAAAAGAAAAAAAAATATNGAAATAGTAAAVAAAGAVAAGAAAGATTNSEALAKESEEQPKEETRSETAPNQPKKKKRTKGTGDLALKTMMKKYLGRDIQMQGNSGHDSLEDALAARDLVHWMVMQRLAEKNGVGGVSERI